jgi:hypothetical protein
VDAPDPSRVRELATQLILHNARVRDGETADVLGEIPENQALPLDDDGDAQWSALMTAVEAMARTALVSVTFPAI